MITTNARIISLSQRHEGTKFDFPFGEGLPRIHEFFAAENRDCKVFYSQQCLLKGTLRFWYDPEFMNFFSCMRK